MRRTGFNVWRAALATAALVAITVIVGPRTVGAQEPGRGEGIKVHGAWVIDVRNADGSLADHREFTNDLVPNGGIELSKVLAKVGQVDLWNIILSGEPQPLSADDFTAYTATSQPCFVIAAGGLSQPAASNVPGPCYLLEATSGFGAGISGVLSANLQFATQAAGSGRMVVSGSVTTGRNGFIRVVSTHFGNPYTGGLQGLTGFPSLARPFSRAILQTPIQVTAGQLITVSVTYTFS